MHASPGLFLALKTTNDLDRISVPSTKCLQTPLDHVRYVNLGISNVNRRIASSLKATPFPQSRQAHSSIWIGCPSVSGHEVIARWLAIAAQESVDGSNAAQFLAFAPQQSQNQDQLTSVSRLYLTSSIGSSRCPVPRGDW